MKTNDDQCQYAGFWVRFVAIEIDFLIVYLLLRAIIVSLEQLGVFDYFELATIFTIIAYMAIFIGGKGRTIGKLLCGLAVRDTKNQRIGYLRVLLREVVGKFLAAVFLFLGFFWAGFFRSKRGWHDYIARTVVVQEARSIKRGRWVLAAVLVANVLVPISIVIMFLINVSNLQERNVLRLDAIDVSELITSDHERLVAHLAANGRPPLQYIVTKFKQHDVVLLGENHEVREVCELISSLVLPLYQQANVRYFAIECLKYKNQHMVNELVTAEEYDEELVLRLFRDCGWPNWGFQEYMDILKAIWHLNSSLHPNEEKLKVVCLESDWDGSVLWSGRHLWKLPGIFYRMATRDKFMSRVLEREVLKKGGRALVQVGAAHAYTHYGQPLVKNAELIAEAKRFGFILHEKYGDQIFQVTLHAGSPLGGLLEKVFAKNGSTAVGFDVVGSPFALLRNCKENSFAHQKYVVFSDISQGYVFLKPFKELQKVAWATGFVNEGNFEILRDRLIGISGGKIRKEDCQTPEELNRRWVEFYQN